MSRRARKHLQKTKFCLSFFQMVFYCRNRKVLSGKIHKNQKAGVSADFATIFSRDLGRSLYFSVPLLNEGWGQAKSTIIPVLRVCESKKRLTRMYSEIFVCFKNGSEKLRESFGNFQSPELFCVCKCHVSPLLKNLKWLTIPY